MSAQFTPEKKVSSKELRSKLDHLEYLVATLASCVQDTKRELHAIIQEIGEDW